jgi:hypothetical protein
MRLTPLFCGGPDRTRICDLYRVKVAVATQLVDSIECFHRVQGPKTAQDRLTQRKRSAKLTASTGDPHGWHLVRKLEPLFSRSIAAVEENYRREWIAWAQRCVRRRRQRSLLNLRWRGFCFVDTRRNW